MKLLAALFYRHRRSVEGTPPAWGRMLLGLVGVFEGALLLLSGGMIGSRVGQAVSLYLWTRTLYKQEKNRERLSDTDTDERPREGGGGD